MKYPATHVQSTTDLEPAGDAVLAGQAVMVLVQYELDVHRSQLPLDTHDCGGSSCTFHGQITPSGMDPVDKGGTTK